MKRDKKLILKSFKIQTVDKLDFKKGFKSGIFIFKSFFYYDFMFFLKNKKNIGIFPILPSFLYSYFLPFLGRGHIF